jgi:hypothetical protein
LTQIKGLHELVSVASQYLFHLVSYANLSANAVGSFAIALPQHTILPFSCIFEV